MRRGLFGSKLGIYFAAIGSAFGLGSLWRFPFVVAENGGGAFVLIYALCLLLLGLPILIGDLIIGKFTKRSVISAARQLVAHKQTEVKSSFLLRIAPKVATLSVIVCLLVLAYYSVISGWVLHYLFQFVAAPFQSDPQVLLGTLDKLKSAGWLQVLLTSVHLLVVGVVVLKDMEDGIEKVVGYVVPIFLGIVFVLMLRALQLETRNEGLRFFLYPDFTKLTLNSLGAAVGQLCFTLSLGFATMITFGSFMQDQNRSSGTGFRVAGLDSLAAIIAGLLIFPLMAMGNLHGPYGPDLLFRTLPDFFLQWNGGIAFGIFFFICLYLAAVGASISIVETVVSNLKEAFHLERKKATLISVSLTFLVSIVPALATSIFSDVRIGTRDILSFWDWSLLNWVVPILALFMSQLVVYKMNPEFKRGEFGPDGDPAADILYYHWSLVMKWVVPPLIGLGLLLQLVQLVL